MSRICLRAMGAFLLLAWLLVPLTASAHEEVESGSYVLTIGWTNEPVIVGQPNSLYLFIAPKAEGEHSEESEHTEGDTHEAANGVADAEATLEFAVEYGSVRRAYELQPIFGQPGLYAADFIPAREGQYTFHFTGTINGEAVDVTFEPEEVESAAALEFPEPSITTSDLSIQLQAAQGQVRTAQTIGIVGAVLGVIGIGLGAFALMRKK